MDPEYQPSVILEKKSKNQWVLLGLALFTLGIIMAVTQWRDYDTVGATEREQLRTQVRVIDDSLTTQIQSADAALRTMLASMERWRGPNGYLPFAQEHLHRVANMIPGTRTFAVMDPNGICQLSNRSELLGRDFSSRAYFQQAAADKSGASLHIAAPQQTVLKVWSLSVSRAIVRPNGEFGGVVVATLSPVYFETLMKSLQYAPDLQTTLIHDQGQVYVSLPAGVHLREESKLAADSIFSSHLATGQPEASFVRPRPDGKQHMVATRTVSLQDLQATHQFVAVASREVDAVYAAWRFMSTALSSIWLAIAALSAWTLWRHQRNEALLAAKVESSQLAVHQSHQRYEQLAQTIPCMLFDFDVSGQSKAQLTYVGPYSQTLLGIAPEVLVADLAQFFDMIHPEDRPGFVAVFQEAITKLHGYDYEFRLVSGTGIQRWLKTTATPAASTTKRDVTHFSGFTFDITETKTQQLQLEEIAYQDPLTQLDNRRSFMEKLQTELSRVQRYGNPAALLMLDIDFFKQVNDTHGHLVGDAVLQQLSGVMRAGMRSVDSLGRLGGEEFAILLPDTDLPAAVALAERLRLAVQSNPLITDTHSVSYALSIGVAAIDAESADTRGVLNDADQALYMAKQTGRNRVCTAADVAARTNTANAGIDADAKAC